jgi:hypothetical protein
MTVAERRQIPAGFSPVLQAIDTLLRGTGQVMFQNNPFTGLLFLIGIFYNSILLGAAGVLGLVVSTLTALLLGIDSALIRAGLFGFNGILVGIAFATFMEFNLVTALYVVVAAATSTIIMASLANLLSSWDVAPLTAPFVLATWIFLLPVYAFSQLTPSDLIPGGELPARQPVDPALSPAMGVPGAWDVVNLAQALFRAVGQVDVPGQPDHRNHLRPGHPDQLPRFGRDGTHRFGDWSCGRGSTRSLWSFDLPQTVRVQRGSVRHCDRGCLLPLHLADNHLRAVLCCRWHGADGCANRGTNTTRHASPGSAVRDRDLAVPPSQGSTRRPEGRSAE